MSNILVIAEVRAGKLKRPSLEAITAAQQLAAKTGGKVIALAIGSGLDAAGQELAAAAHQVVLADALGLPSSRAMPMPASSPSSARRSRLLPC